ncbi:hypothetical protein [Actinopolyspora mortivallis]|uniref:Uncharacterized protein n=1 Tax=Actinopolyspora mortivallis TaxID=33906 RepID=A0A2T0GZD5_ACTMO|nr:hypothetical protein [Actinopolyspora mortivallis]PRW64450.1 hypothetical protein CEP50_05930 [Actinopolyspora mortivallis]
MEVVDIPRGPLSSSVSLNRRRLLGLSALLPWAPVLLGCSASGAPSPDPLVPLAANAAEDERLARATAAEAELSEQAELVARVRAEHAKALRREIERLGGDPGTPSTTSPPSPGPESTRPGRTRLRSALREAQGRAEETVPLVTGHQAGLVGSVSAACASLLEVV